MIMLIGSNCSILLIIHNRRFIWIECVRLDRMCTTCVNDLVVVGVANKQLIALMDFR